jgi:hypothetical protein
MGKSRLPFTSPASLDSVCPCLDSVPVPSSLPQSFGSRYFGIWLTKFTNIRMRDDRADDEEVLRIISQNNWRLHELMRCEEHIDEAFL